MCIRDSWNEPEPFFRGMLVESGYDLETVGYPRPNRAGGHSKNDFLSILDFAVSAVAGSSKALLRLPIYIALVLCLPALGLVIACAVIALQGGAVLPYVVLAAIAVATTLVLLFLGLVGEQVRMISERTRNVPLVIERERINFPRPPSA